VDFNSSIPCMERIVSSRPDDDRGRSMIAGCLAKVCSRSRPLSQITVPADEEDCRRSTLRKGRVLVIDVSDLRISRL